MDYPSFGPETALALLRALLYSMACVCAGAVLIALSVYAVLVCSEMFAQPRSQTRRAKVPGLASRAPVAEEGLDGVAAETPILAVPSRLGEDAVRTAPPYNAQIPMKAPANLESEPSLP